MSPKQAKLILYTSNYCNHSWAVERFMTDHEIDVQMINIDKNRAAREKLIDLNDGFASVPTLIFPDGEKMVEPSFRQLRKKLGIETDSLWSKVRGWFS